MLKMSAICIYTSLQTVPEIRDRLADCVLRQIVPSLHKRRLQFRDVLQLRIQVTELLKYRPPNTTVKWIDVCAIWWPGVFVKSGQ